MTTMKTSKKLIFGFTLLLTLCFSVVTYAQDRLFSQFYTAPLTLNPALAGSFDGKYRVGGIYRDQWSSIVQQPFRSFAFGADFRLTMPALLQNMDKDRVGIGLMFQRDHVGTYDFSNTQLNVALAYHKSLDWQNTQYLSAGIQFGLNQRNLNYERLTFQDQFNGLDGYTGTTGERLPENNFGFGDLSGGINYTYSQRGRFGFFAGIAFHHFATPNVSFYRTIRDSITNSLPVRYSAHVATQIPISENVMVSPRIYATLQGEHLQLNVGTNFRFVTGRSGLSSIHLGAWLRPTKNTGAFAKQQGTDSFGIGSVVFLTGFEYNNVLFGFSYDLNIDNLRNYYRPTNAIEFSLIYLGEFENEEILCPAF
jgi:type IX secretion system PorP/SprF family membrane protein